MAHSTLAHKPTYVSHENRRFLIMDAPTDRNLPSYIEECKKHSVCAVVRACEPTYGIQPLQQAGISVHELPFPDGDPPPPNVISTWLDLCDETFSTSAPNGNVNSNNSAEDPSRRTIAVHCVAGLGRAPVLVVLALIETGMEALDAIEFVRKRRRGAINARQLKFLESYEPRNSSSGCCVIL